MKIVLGTSWRTFEVWQEGGLPSLTDVLNVLESGRPIRVVGENAADLIWLTPAAIMTVEVEE